MITHVSSSIYWLKDYDTAVDYTLLNLMSRLLSVSRFNEYFTFYIKYTGKKDIIWVLVYY